MSKVINRLKHRDEVTVRIAAADIPLHLCLENHEEVGSLDNYQDKIALEVGDVLLVKDAP